jgi:hypothetical protein
MGVLPVTVMARGIGTARRGDEAGDEEDQHRDDAESAAGGGMLDQPEQQGAEPVGSVVGDRVEAEVLGLAA